MKDGLIEPGATFTIIVPEENIHQRIDVFLGNYFAFYSRSFFQQLLTQELIKVNDSVATKPSTVLKPGDEISIQFPPALQYYASKELPEDLNIQVVFTHPHFLIINKPANLVVHAPFIGAKDISLVDWLLKHFNEIRQVGTEDRPGIVHRLDKNTSGLIIVPRNNYAHNLFSTMFKDRTIQKTYHALVQGHTSTEGTIDFPISRDPFLPTKMTHTKPDGRASVTHFKVLHYFDDATLLELKPTTGRTHQLRVHCAAMGHPIIGDIVYGKKSKLIDRQALHAHSLAFEFEGEPFSFCVEPPEDFQRALKALPQP